jgi:hypothetical protein
MSQHINRFLEKLQAAESRRSYEVCLTLREAQDLHRDITRLLLEIESQRSTQVNVPDVIDLEVKGGSF